MISSKETLQATTLQGCRYPHTLSCSPHKVSSHERLGLLVELSAFLHCAEALDLQFLPCLRHCKHPGVLLSFQGLLLAHDTSMLEFSGCPSDGLRCLGRVGRSQSHSQSGHFNA